MRTTLSKQDVAFERGYQAYLAGVLKTSNPYSYGSDERSAWFAGWDRAQECDGTCDG